MHTWKVEGLKAYPRLDGKTNVVYSVHWRCGLIDGIAEFAPSDQFVPFENLTEETVLGWLWAKTPKAVWEARATKAEEEAKNPTPEPVTVLLPWG